ncbi:MULTISPECIES: response regulator transcription factor [Bordetella]|nr:MULTISPECIES: LuxR C-terminal-related transcriptional regulator [Bordetella]
MQSDIASELFMQDTPPPHGPAAIARLTPREQQIVSYLAAGRPNKVVAIELGISLRTAEAHRARIFRKLGVRNALELACRLCPRQGTTSLRG